MVQGSIELPFDLCQFATSHRPLSTHLPASQPCRHPRPTVLPPVATLASSLASSASTPTALRGHHRQLAAHCRLTAPPIHAAGTHHTAAMDTVECARTRWPRDVPSTDLTHYTPIALGHDSVNATAHRRSAATLGHPSSPEDRYVQTPTTPKPDGARHKL